MINKKVQSVFIVSWHLILSCKPSSHKVHLQTQTHEKNLMLERNINNLKMFNLSTLPKHTSIKVDWFLGKFAAGNIYFIQENLPVPNNSKLNKSLFTLFWSMISENYKFWCLHYETNIKTYNFQKYKKLWEKTWI